MYDWNENFDRFETGAEPTAILDGAMITGQSGFLSGTHVASNLGWRAVQDLAVGDSVLTFDHGMQPIIDIQRDSLYVSENTMSASSRPLRVPAGALYNRCPLWLMPDQGMLIESDATEDCMGDPFAVIPARLLKGVRGITCGFPCERLDITTIAFAQDEVVYVEGGMLAHCPHPEPIWTDDASGPPRLYDVVDGQAARFVADCLIAQDDIASLASDPKELPGFQEEPAIPGRPIMI
ncbi:MAG: Hint domain-containing protein [Pseudomonadota bacterium]